jgi:hypothetical protein
MTAMYGRGWIGAAVQGLMQAKVDKMLERFERGAQPLTYFFDHAILSLISFPISTTYLHFLIFTAIHILQQHQRKIG